MAKAIQAINTLQSGQLATHEAHNPSSQKYANGLISANGVRFIGGRATHANGVRDFTDHKFRTDFVPFPDGGTYIRNSSALLADTVSALSADLPSSTVQSLNDRIDSMFAQQKHLARIGSAEDPDHVITGRNDMFLDGISSGNSLICSNTTDSIYVAQDIPYYKAVIYTDPETNTRRWGVVGIYKLRIGDYDQNGIKNGIRRYAICNGNEYASKNIYYGSNSNGSINYVTTINIYPIQFVIKKGWYHPLSNIGLYLVGKMGMFNSSSVYEVKDLNTYVFSSTYDSLDTGGTKQSPSGLDNIPIFRWATTSEDQTVYNPSDSNHLAEWYQETSINDIFGPVATSSYSGYSFSSATGGAVRQFYFTTARNKVIKLRRCGVAQFVDTASSSNKTNSERDFYVGFTKLATSPGDSLLTTIGTSTTDDGSQYIAYLGSKPLWVEAVYQGVFAGTSEGEYLISNEQLAKSYTVQKISSVGSGAETTDYTDVATSLYGITYFITKRGIAHLNFSTERNSYIPSIVDMLDMGFSRPVSICSSKSLNCVIIHCSDGTIVQMAPDTGALSVIDVGSPSTSISDTYLFKGVATEDGEAKFVWISNTGVYVQSFLSDSISIPSTLVTTAFSNNTNSNVKFNKIIISISKSFGGKVGVYGKELVDIPYTADEIAARSFTGVKTILVNDLISAPGEEKCVEVSFESNNEMNISYVGIEGEA